MALMAPARSRDLYAVSAPGLLGRRPLPSSAAGGGATGVGVRTATSGLGVLGFGGRGALATTGGGRTGGGGGPSPFGRMARVEPLDTWARRSSSAWLSGSISSPS